MQENTRTAGLGRSQLLKTTGGRSLISSTELGWPPHHGARFVSNIGPRQRTKTMNARHKKTVVKYFLRLSACAAGHLRWHAQTRTHMKTVTLISFFFFGILRLKRLAQIYFLHAHQWDTARHRRQSCVPSPKRISVCSGPTHLAVTKRSLSLIILRHHCKHCSGHSWGQHKKTKEPECENNRRVSRCFSLVANSIYYKADPDIANCLRIQQCWPYYWITSLTASWLPLQKATELIAASAEMTRVATANILKF